MKKVILGIGVPGSGKSTVLKKFADQYHYTYISPDAIREELIGDAADQSRNAEVWQEAYVRTAKALGNGKTVVFDATFANADLRKEFLRFAREQGAEKIQGVYLDIPLEIAQKRNQKRVARIVPRDIIATMHTSLSERPPSLEDGFDAVFTLDEYQELERVERTRYEKRL